MTFIRCLAALLALACLPPNALSQPATLPQVYSPASTKVSTTGTLQVDINGNAIGTPANPLVTNGSAPASSIACVVSATTSAATITVPSNCTATGSAGTYVVGPFTPQAGYAVRLVTTGTWAGSIAVGTSVDNCATVNALTVAGQTWGTFTGNANEVVDVPPTTGGIAYCLSITLTSGTLNAALRQ